MNLTRDYRILITVAIRFTASKIGFNSQTNPNTWGDQELIDIQGVFNEIGATISIRINEDDYVISVDGKEIYTYQKRIYEDATGVSYRSNTDATVLSDPVAVYISEL